jgi:hypothetical protein
MDSTALEVLRHGGGYSLLRELLLYLLRLKEVSLNNTNSPIGIRRYHFGLHYPRSSTHNLVAYR